MDPTVLHIVGGEARLRAEQARIGFALGHRAEVYADEAELLERLPEEGIVLAADTGTPSGIPQLIGRLDQAGLWLPLVCTAEQCDVERVVAAMRAGALDYWALPLEANRFARHLQAIGAEAVHYVARRRGEIEARRSVARLSQRERQVLDQLSEGLTNKEIAIELRISPRTVEIHRANMMGKLGARHVSEAVRAWMLARAEPAGPEREVAAAPIGPAQAEPAVAGRYQRQ